MPTTTDTTASPLPIWREPWRSLVLLAAVLVLVLARSGPPAAKPVDAPLTEFSAARARQTLARILCGSDALSSAPCDPHPVGTAAHERVRERLLAEMARLGPDVEVQEAFVAGPHANVALVRNVVARIPGREHASSEHTSTERTSLEHASSEHASSQHGSPEHGSAALVMHAPASAVLLLAHYDSVAAGPGAGDDGAGVAAVLEIARAITSGAPLGRDVILLFTDGEELGLVGARAFCREHRWAADVGAAVNLEGRGTCGPSEMFETSDDNARLMPIFACAVDRPAAVSLAYEVYKRMPNDTDMSVLKRAGMSGFNFAFIGGSRRYHTPLDDLEHLDLGSLQHHGDNGLALARALAETELTPPSARAGTEPARSSALTEREDAQRGARTERQLAPSNAMNGIQPARANAMSERRAVYADVLGLVLVRWPDVLALPIALIELTACAMVVPCLRRSRIVVSRDFALGAVSWLAVLVCSALLGALVSRVSVWASGVPEPWAGKSAWMACGIACAALLACALAACVVSARRVAVTDAWTGAWLAFLAVGVAVAAWLPSASYLFAIPGAIAVLACVVRALAPQCAASKLEPALALVPLTAAAIVWMQLAVGLERALEYRAAIANAAVSGAAIACALPAWTAARRADLAALIGAAALIALVSIGVLSFNDAGSRDEPAHLILARVVDCDRREERWLAASYGWPLPAALLTAGFAARAEPNPFPWWVYAAEVHATSSVASSARVDEIAPACRVIASHESINGASSAPANSASSAQANSASSARANGAGTAPVNGAPNVLRLGVRSQRGARGIVVTARGARIRTVALRGRELAVEDGALLGIVGAGDDEIELALETTDGSPAEIEIADSLRLAADEGAAMQRARPETWVPRGEGDVSIAVRRFAPPH